MTFAPGKHIVALSGSIAIDSANRRLLRALHSRLGARGHFFRYEDRLDEIPYFHPEQTTSDRIPERVRRLKKTLAECDAIVVSSPEYGHAIPGVFKNALDWLYSGDDLRGKPLLLASVASSGGTRVLDQLLDVFNVLGSNVQIPPLSLYPAVVRKLFLENGEQNGATLEETATERELRERSLAEIDAAAEAFAEAITPSI